MSAADAFAELVAIMERLRAPGGCPWDREQTHASIKPYVIEEAFEVAEAIDAKDDEELRIELGDLLLQIVFHAEMAREAGRFTVEDVVRGIIEKMVRRHPHVFSDTEVKDASEVLRNWARIKSDERKHKQDNSVVSGVPRAMPALLRAHRLGEKASHVGFDWDEPSAVFDKVREEIAELESAMAKNDPSKSAEVDAELGDVLFALSSLGRHLGTHAEDALQRASDRFVRRFRYIEEQLTARGHDIHAASLQEMAVLWQEAKQHDSAANDQ